MLKEQMVICWSETCGRQPNNNSRVKNKKYFFILIVRSLVKVLAGRGLQWRF